MYLITMICLDNCCSRLSHFLMKWSNVRNKLRTRVVWYSEMAKNTDGKIHLFILVLLDVTNFFITLQVLNISSNRLKALPDSIGQLERLRVLNTSYNRLKALPDSIGNLKWLEHLDLQDNQHLKVLPAALARATRLKEIKLDSMRFIYPPEEIVVQGVFAVMEFLSKGES